MMAQGEPADPGGPNHDNMDTDQPSTSKETKPATEELKLDLDVLDEGNDDDMGDGFVTRGEIDDAARRDGSGSIDGGSTIRLDDLDSEDLPPPEMTPEEKQAMVDCVRRGDIDEFEELLDIPGADINMVWFSENLLMTAVRWKREEMALYLIDNGVNVLFETTRLQKYEDPNDPKKIVLRVYTVSCRQIAYDNGLQDVVDIIDMESGEDVMHTVTERTKRLWKPKEVREFEKLRATHEVLSDLSSITAVDLLWEDDGAMADTEVTNSTVNSPRERTQTPSDKTDSLVSEKGLVVDTRVVMDVQPGEPLRVSLGDKKRPDLPFVSGDVHRDSREEDRANRKISRDSLRNRPVPEVVVEGEEGRQVGLKTAKKEGADDANGQASGDNSDPLPCHSRGACTDDGLYGKRSPISANMTQSRAKSAGFTRIGGTRTDMYRKRDSKRKLMLREQDQNGADYSKPVMANGSYPFESKRWSVEDGHKSPGHTPRECVAPIGARQTPPISPCGHPSEIFIKPRPAFTTPGQPSSRYTKDHDSWDSFPSIGAKTTRLQHKQTYLINVGGRNIRDKKLK